MKAPIDAMLMMEPLCCASIARPNAWHGRKLPLRFSAMSAS